MEEVDLTVFGWSDSDWGGDGDTRKSTAGFVFMMNKWCSQLELQEADNGCSVIHTSRVYGAHPDRKNKEAT